MNDWITIPLPEVLDFKEGPGILAKDFREEGVPLIRLAGMKRGASILKGCNFLDPSMVDRKWDHFRLARGDVVLSTSASLGEVAVVADEGIGAIPYTGLIRFRSKDERVLARFIPVALTAPSFKRQIEAMGAGSVLRHFGPMHLKQMSLEVPPREIQDRIADVTEAVDAKIASNSRVIALIEALGSALLEQTLALDVYGFPEYESTRRFGDIVAILETGSRPKGGASTTGEGVISLGAESVQSAGVISTENFKTVPEDFAARLRRGWLQSEDVLVYKDGGKPGNFIPHISAFGYGFPVDRAVINEHVYRARAVDGISQGLLYWLLRSTWMDEEMRKRGTGVAIPGLNSTNFRDLPLPVMTREATESLNRVLSPMFASLLHYGAENQGLKAARQALLPELLSGRIGIPEVEEARV